MRKKTTRARRIVLRLTDEELRKLELRFKNSTCRNLSQYARLVLFGKTVVTRYRTAALDDLMAELIVLGTDLRLLGNDFNQAVRRLNTIDTISEVRTWLITYDDDKNKLLQRVEDVKLHIQKVAETLLQ